MLPGGKGSAAFLFLSGREVLGGILSLRPGLQGGVACSDRQASLCASRLCSLSAGQRGEDPRGMVSGLGMICKQASSESAKDSMVVFAPRA